MRNFCCHLTGAVFSGDIECPHCNKKWDVEWDTEYGDPLRGYSQTVECIDCRKKFSFTVEVTTTYTVSK